MRTVLAAAGYNCAQYSFGIGVATTAAQCGMPDSLIKTLGHWESVVYTVYICTPRKSSAMWQRSLLGRTVSDRTSQVFVIGSRFIILNICSCLISFQSKKGGKLRPVTTLARLKVWVRIGSLPHCQPLGIVGVAPTHTQMDRVSLRYIIKGRFQDPSHGIWGGHLVALWPRPCTPA